MFIISFGKELQCFEENITNFISVSVPGGPEPPSVSCCAGKVIEKIQEELEFIIKGCGAYSVFIIGLSQLSLSRITIATTMLP